MRCSSRVWWPALAGAWAALSLLAWMGLGPTGHPQPTGADTWAWQAGQPLSHQAVTWFTAALIHHSLGHLWANVGAAAAVAAWGWTAGCRGPQALAWLMAWPLSQALLGLDSAGLWRYAGLSATLHAGVAIACLHLLVTAQGLRRAVGVAVSVAVLIKLNREVPALHRFWNPDAPAFSPEPLMGAAGHVVAGQAHGCGVLAGVAACLMVGGIITVLPRKRRP